MAVDSKATSSPPTLSLGRAGPSDIRSEGDIYSEIIGNGNAIGGHGNINFIYNYASKVVNEERANEDEFSVLCKHIALSALRDSGDESQHHSEQEIQDIVLEYLETWTTTPIHKYPILWIHGSQGKSVLQKMDQLHWSRYRLFSRFFFSQPAIDPQYFIATIAFQLILALPATRQYIIDAIRENKHIVDFPLQAQAQALVISPIRQACAESSFDFSRWTIVVGALDKCASLSRQSEILEVLQSISQQLPIPFSAIVTSRFQVHMREGLRTSSLQIDLDNIKLHLDAKTALIEEFEAIRETHPMRALLPQAWPPEKFVNELVARASGQMIYVQTVGRFLRSTSHNPAERLNALKEFGALGGEVLAPSENLDTLYSTLLCTVNQAELVNLLRLLGFLLVPYLERGPKDPRDAFSSIQFKAIRTPAYLEELFGWRPGYVRRLLEDQQHFLNVGNNFEDIIMYDSSIRDYFFDSSRSCKFFIDEGNVYADLAEYCIHSLTAHKLENWKNFLLFFMWNSNHFISKATPRDELRRAIEHCKITKIHPARSYPDSINDIWPTFLGAIQKSAIAESEGLYAIKLLEYENILQYKMKVYFEHISLKSFFITMALTWINLEGLAKSMFQIPLEETEKERTLGFNILNCRDCPNFMPFVRKLLGDDGWRDCFVDEDQYADVALYLLKNIFKRQRAISAASWLSYFSFPGKYHNDDTLDKIFPALLSKCSPHHHDLSQFIKSKASMLRYSSGAPFRDAVEDYIERSNFAATVQESLWRPVFTMSSYVDK